MKFTSRRLVYRTAFVGLCLLPTLFIISRIVATSLPGYMAAYEHYLSNELGWRVTFADLSHSRPGQTSIESLQIHDEETGEILMAAAKVSIEHRHEEMQIVFEQPRLEARRLHELVATIHDRLLRRPRAITQRVRLIAAQVEVEHGTDKTIIHDVQAHYQPTETRSSMTLLLRFDETQVSEPIVVQLDRDHQNELPETSLAIRTHGNALACSDLRMFVPVIRRLGDECLLEGEMQGVVGSDNHWRGEGKLRLTGVDLSRLVSDHFPQRLSGIANVTCEEVAFHQGRLTRCRGSIISHDGEIGRSLLVSAQHGMSLRRPDNARGRFGERMRYSELFVEFELDDAGLTLRGRKNSDPPGAIVSDKSGVLLREPNRQSLPMMGLLRLLVPRDGTIPYMVPATYETDRLLQYLPFPLRFRHPQLDGVPQGRLERMQ